MNIELNQDGLCLKPNQVVTVRGGLGHSIVCHSGVVWVTQDGDPRAISIAQPEPQTRAARLPALLKSALSGAGLARGGHVLSC
jgi:hypothetical protein